MKKYTCPSGTWCDSHDKIHFDMFLHPFNLPCKYGINCTNYTQEHKATYSHLCNWGQNCVKLHDPEHIKMYTHKKLPVCNDTFCNCTLDRFHRMEFSHVGMPDVMIRCKFGGDCKYASAYLQNKSLDDEGVLRHMIEFYH